MAKEQNPNLIEEDQLPEEWQEPLEAKPVIPGESPAAVSAVPSVLPPYFRGSISSNLQHDFYFVGTDKTPRVASLPLMPVAPSGNPQNNAAIQSGIIENVPAPVPASSSGMNFRGTWRNFVFYKINDVVIDNGSSYVAITASTDLEPDQGNTTNWVLLGKNLNLRGIWQGTPAVLGPPMALSSPNPPIQGTPSPGYGGCSAGGSRVFDATQSGATETFLNSAANAVYNSLPAFTIAAWVNISGTAALVVWVKDPFNSYNNLMQVVKSGTTWHIDGTVDNTAGSTKAHSRASNNPLSAGTWYHIAMSFDINGDKKIHLYVDGVETTYSTQTTDPDSVVADDSGGGWYVGDDGLGFGDGFGGSIAEFVIFNTKLSGGQISSLASSTTGAFGISDPNLAGYWHICGVASPEPSALSVPGVSVTYNPYDVVEFEGSTWLCVVTTTGSPATAPTSWQLLAQGAGFTNVQTGNYLAVTLDHGRLISFNDASPVTLTLPSPILDSGWWIAVQNIGAGTLTINPNGKNIDGSAGSLTLNQNQGLFIYTDGNNYFTAHGVTGLSVPSIFVNGGVNGSGLATLTLATQTANTVFAGPTSGAAAVPTFRALVSADLPPLADATVSTTGNTTTQSGNLQVGGAVVPAGLYRVSGYILVTTGGVAATLTPALTWNDGTLARTATFAAIDASAQNVGSFSQIVKANGATNIAWSVTLANSATFSVFISLERLF
jgi:hypothetical protein